MICQQRGQIGLHTIKRHDGRRVELATRTISVDLNLSVAPILYHPDIVSEIARPTVQRRHAIHIARRSRAGIAAIGKQIAQVNTVSIRRPLPGTDGKAVDHITAIAPVASEALISL